MPDLPELHGEDALIERLALAHERGRSVVFLVGAALTAPATAGTRGVPGVEGMIGKIRARLPGRTIPKPTAANPYQDAFSQLLGSAGPDEANQVVREAVLEACDCEDSERSSAIAGKVRTCKKLEGGLEAWHLSPGVAALGQLARSFPETLGRIVLTTNFDPLIAIAVGRAGGRAWRTVLDADDSLDKDDAAGCRVVHGHGHWARTDTLHTPQQLRRKRPKLEKSLVRLFSESVLVAIGYGGWDDVFTRAIARVVRDDDAKPEVLWTFYGADPGAVRKAPVMKKLSPGLERGRATLYGGVDCHRFLPALVERLRPGASVATPTLARKRRSVARSTRGRSPFIVGKPIERDEDFYGRESQREEALAALRAGSSVQVLGETRMGKTSLLRWVERHAPSVQERPVVSLSAQGSAGRSPRDFVEAWAHALRPELAAADRRPAELVADLIPAVLLVDEGDLLAAPGRDFDHDFLVALRDRCQSGELVWISAAQGDLHAQLGRAGRSSRFLNDARKVWVGRLEADAVRTLLRGHVDEEAITVVRRESGDLPLLVQALAERLWRGDGEEKAIDRVTVDQESILADWWRHRDDETRALLKRVAREPAKRGDLPRKDRIRLTELELRGLVSEEEGRFAINGALWRNTIVDG